MMYLISENYKHSRNGGKYICNVFIVSSLEKGPIDVSEDVARIFELEYEEGSIIIRHGCGTGIMWLTQRLKQDEPKASVYDVSVFNQ